MAVGQDVRCTSALLVAGGEFSVDLRVRVGDAAAGQSVINTATVSSSVTDAIPAGLSASAVLAVEAAAAASPPPTPSAPAPPPAVTVMTSCHSRRAFVIRLIERSARASRSAEVLVAEKRVAVMRRSLASPTLVRPLRWPRTPGLRGARGVTARAERSPVEIDGR